VGVRDATPARVPRGLRAVAAAAGVAVEAARRYAADAMDERAPAIAYYAVLSIFPAVLLLVAVIRIIGGDSAPEDIAAYARAHGVSGPLADSLRSVLDTARQTPTPGASAAGAFGVLTTVYGASRALTATGQALDVMDGRPRRPRTLRRRAQDVGWTVVLVVVAAVAAVLVTVSGSVLRDLFEAVGLGGPGAALWSVLRWPAAAALVLLLVALVRWVAPSGPRSRFRLLTPGTLTTTAALLAGGAGFNAYVATVGHYNQTYGAFAGAVILMVGVWLSAVAFLYGAELDTTLDDRRQGASSQGVSRSSTS
jgi:membrane protein